ncbi:MAG: RNA methyltransferase [Candidatus Binataceae bacterium]
MAALFVSLIHYPVLDRNGRIITSAITSLDLHDIARSARTYGARGFFVVHPVAEQREFARSVLAHWLNGYGRRFDSRRREALDLIHIVETLEQMIETSHSLCGAPPLLIYTSARAPNGISFDELRAKVRESSAPIILMFGTGFGLAPAMLERADLVLEPIHGSGDYNHLSVRAAAAIMLDRLCG